MWSRVQTAMAVEGGMLYGLYADGVHLGTWERPALAVVGSLFVLLACIIPFSDRADIEAHMNRVREFEQAAGQKFVKTKISLLRASTFLLIVGIFLTASNLVILKQILFR